jgi:hypothetical protein
MSDNVRKMPRRVDLGKQFSSTMAQCMGQRKEWAKDPMAANPHGLRTVMGFCLPHWQRPLVWTLAQKVSFIESAWRGINLGTYTYNQVDMGHPLDNLLIDGQQRMNTIECYLNDEFPVFGCRWSEVTPVDERIWSMTTIFGSYVTETTNEAYLRGYYDMTNFGGTPHTEDQRASVTNIDQVA